MHQFKALNIVFDYLWIYHPALLEGIVLILLLPKHERSRGTQLLQSSYRTRTGTWRTCRECPGIPDETMKYTERKTRREITDGLTTQQGLQRFCIVLDFLTEIKLVGKLVS